MATLLIFRGNSGSGKSTLAKEVHKRLPQNTLLIPQDTVRRDMLNAKDGKNTKALPLLESLLEYGSQNCEYVILEGILNSEWYKPLFEQAQNLYDDIFAYYFDIPFEETIQRHKQRKISSFGEERMKDWWNEKDYIGIIPETSFSKSLSLDDEIKLVMDNLHNS